jgi:hypothetical protein
MSKNCFVQVEVSEVTEDQVDSDMQEVMALYSQHSMQYPAVTVMVIMSRFFS